MVQSHVSYKTKHVELILRFLISIFSKTASSHMRMHFDAEMILLKKSSTCCIPGTNHRIVGFIYWSNWMYTYCQFIKTDFYNHINNYIASYFFTSATINKKLLFFNPFLFTKFFVENVWKGGERWRSKGWFFNVLLWTKWTMRRSIAVPFFKKKNLHISSLLCWQMIARGK